MPARHQPSLAGRPLATALFCLILAFALQACAPGRGLEAWQLLNDLSDSFAPGIGQADIPRQTVRYGPGVKPFTGDLYRAAAPAMSLVLVPGAAESGKDDPRLIAVARAFARKGFTVLVPDIANLRRLHVAASDAGQIAAAVGHLAALGGSEKASVAILAVSYAVGPAVIAALAPPALDQVKAIVAVGGYHDLTAVITFFTTGRFRLEPGVPWQERRPNSYGKWVFLLSNSARLDDRRDRVLLRALARRKLHDPNAGDADLVGRLGAEGRAVWRLLENRDPDAVPGLIAQLPPGIKGEIAALDLKGRDLAPLKAEVILLHGQDDPIIPATESQALARALPDGLAHLYLLDGLDHVELRPAGLADRLQLWRAAYRLLELRDSLESDN